MIIILKPIINSISLHYFNGFGPKLILEKLHIFSFTKMRTIDTNVEMY